MRKIFATLFAAALAIGVPATAASADEGPTASTCSYECVWTGETAWVGTHDFAGANWAKFIQLTRTPVTVPPSESFPIYAGQHFHVGNVYVYDGPGDTVLLRVYLNGPYGDGAYFQGGNALKIAHYTTDPSGISNPAPGKFKHKFDPADRFAEVYVPYNPSGANYYAIHLDLMILE
ncbi:hypothetical protein [Demequina silvatica]|uniref:hypothetical protein n=1 Tax=Demequina silvatica TaxID=1638988 RepID=UPI000B2C4F39|nr:hypothetical protein [Demequina silvatica]